MACPAKCQKWKNLTKKKNISNSTGVWAAELPWQVGLYRVSKLKIAKIVMAPLVHYSLSHEKVEIGYFSSLEVESWGGVQGVQGVQA